MGLFLTAYKCLELEDEVKRLTLTGEQYNNWLETNLVKITIKQFEVLYGVNKRKQSDLRSTRHDLLPHIILNRRRLSYC